jgi:hypothetical protein
MKITFIFFALRVLSPAQAPDRADKVSQILTVCEALSMPFSNDGKLVTIRDRLSDTGESSWLVGSGCPGIFVTDGFAWPSGISLQTSNSPVTRLHKPDFSYDLRSEFAIEQKYTQLRRRVSDRCIEWTYTGMFETKQNWASAKVTYRDGTSRFIGFGHMGDAPAQLLVKTADAVSEIPNCDARSGDKRP